MKSEKSLRSILDSIAVGVYVVDADQRIAYANKGFAKLFGFASEDDLLGKDVRSLYSRQDDYRRLIAEAPHFDPRERPIYFRGRTASGSYEDLALTSVTALPPVEVVHRLVITIRHATKEERRPVPGRPKVFISYCHQDLEFAKKLHSDLSEADLTVWLDFIEIAVGDSIPDRIQEAIADSDFFIAVLTSSSVKSAWFKAELDSARIRELELRDTIVLPILAEQCEVPLLLRPKRYADFVTRDYGQALTDLLESIDRHWKNRSVSP